MSKISRYILLSRQSRDKKCWRMRERGGRWKERGGEGERGGRERGEGERGEREGGEREGERRGRERECGDTGGFRQTFHVFFC